MAQFRIPLEDRIRCVRQFSISQNATHVVREWKKHFNTPPPSRPAVTEINKRFDTTGSVADLPRSGRPRCVRTEENVQAVVDKYARSPGTSLRRASLALGMDKSAVRRILADVGMKPFRPILVHELLEDDYDRRIEFCETYQAMLQANPGMDDLILWTDESTFHMNGHVNRHNCVYWASENPKQQIELSMKSPGVTCWAGIWSKGIVGPYFFDGTVTGDSYLAMLNDYLLPQIVALDEGSGMWFMQDGAPAHYAARVRSWLDQNFAGQWIGRRGAVEWPPRSCDLTPPDFFLWGVIKERVYNTKPTSLQDLRDRIASALHALDADLCAKVCRAVSQRTLDCLECDGAQVV
jgi:Helix-turn-helix domain (DUF4817)